MQDIVGASVRGGFYRNEARAADRQRTGFVKHNRMGLRKRFEGTAPFHQDPALRGSRYSRNKRNGSCQNQGARRRRNQHGKAADGITGVQSCAGCHEQCHRQQQERISVRYTDER